MRVSWIVFLLLIVVLPIQQSFAAVKVWEGKIVIPTYAWGPDDKNPVFRATGGRMIYPYPMQDRLGDTKADRTYRALFLENKYLQVCVLPELGGHVHEVFNKSIGQPVFYVNHVIKPNLLAMRGAWISGGIEWNTGPTGHTATCVSPIESRLLSHEDGSASIAIGHVERIFRTQWTVTLTLRPGVAALDEHIRLFNPRDEIHPYYFWNNTAVPNTEGFQFIYPMTLGTDHAGTHFYTWPINNGIDLSYGKNHKGPSGIFAYRCDQDFFGSYDHTLDRGVVATANHHLVPGKKAWTWGQSEHAKLRQQQLTDTDGPYNEVQTGPLPTQANLAFLQPHQVVEWRERWYPVHHMGGFLYADRNAAFNVVQEKNQLTVKVLTTSRFPKARLILSTSGRNSVSYPVDLSPARPAVVHHPIQAETGPWSLALRARKGKVISAFTYPLPLPVRKPPTLPTPIPKNQKTTQDFWIEGQNLDKRSLPDQARARYLQALDKDARYAPALCSLAVLDLESGLYESALEYASRAVEHAPDLGMGWYWKSVALYCLNRNKEALESAWQAARLKTSSALGYGLLARLAIRSGNPAGAVSLTLEALRADDRDSVARNTLSAALFLVGDTEMAERVAADALRDNPLDLVTGSIQYLSAGSKKKKRRYSAQLRSLIRGEPQNTLEISAFWVSLYQYPIAQNILEEFYLKDLSRGEGRPIPWYYAGWLAAQMGNLDEARKCWESARECSPDYVFPHRLETIPILRAALQANPDDSRAALYLGNLLFAKGQLAEGRKLWEESVRVSPWSSVAFRNLGLAAEKLDHDRPQAIQWYEKALKCAPKDPVLYQALARMYRQDGDLNRAVGLLEKALQLPNPRRDSVEMLANLYFDLGRYTNAINFLEHSHFKNWEGQFSSHDVFVRAHIEKGKQLLKAGDAEGALKHFQASKTYPKNLGVGRGPQTREANSNYWIGMALKALGRFSEAKEAFQMAVNEPESPAHRESQQKAAEELTRLK